MNLYLSHFWFIDLFFIEYRKYLYVELEITEYSFYDNLNTQKNTHFVY